MLQRRLLEERVGGLRYRILRGLNRLAAASDVVLDSALLRRRPAPRPRASSACCTGAACSRAGRRELAARATPGHGLLVQLLKDKEAQAIERLLRLLALQYRGEDFRDIYRGLRSRDARQRASSRELLENLLRPPLREPILAIVSEGKDAVRLAGAGELYSARPLDYQAVLERILDEGGESLRCIAVHHIGELDLVALRPLLEALAATGTGLLPLARARAHARGAVGRPGGGVCLKRRGCVPPLERLLHLKRVPLLSGLPTSEVAVLADAAQERFFAQRRRRVPRGRTRRAPCTSSPRVRSPTYRRGIRVGAVGPGGGIGGLAVLARGAMGSHVVAEEDTLTLEIDADAVAEVLEDRLPILQHLLREVNRQALELLRRHRLDPSPFFPEPPRDLGGDGRTRPRRPAAAAAPDAGVREDLGDGARRARAHDGPRALRAGHACCGTRASRRTGSCCCRAAASRRRARAA